MQACGKDMLEIRAITGRSTRGSYCSFFCEANDEQNYYVKGLHAGRASQINEWISGKMAQELGLPIAPFALLKVGEDIYEELPPNWKEIGMGVCFGSLAQPHYSLLEQANISQINNELQRKIAAFDWFIRNEDRTLGNPNLLYVDSDAPLIIIDHNCAFDHEFDPDNFKSNHIFSSALLPVFNSPEMQDEINLWLRKAVNVYSSILNDLPEEWQWSNQEKDIPTKYNFEYTTETVSRLTNGLLWNTL